MSRERRDQLEALHRERRALEAELAAATSPAYEQQNAQLDEAFTSLAPQLDGAVERHQRVHTELDQLSFENAGLRSELRLAEERGLPQELLLVLPLAVIFVVWAFSRGVGLTPMICGAGLTLGLLVGTRGAKLPAESVRDGRALAVLGFAAVGLVGAFFIGGDWAAGKLVNDQALRWREPVGAHFLWSQLTLLSLVGVALVARREEHRLPWVLISLAALITVASWWDFVPVRHLSLDPAELSEQREWASERLVWQDPLRARWLLLASVILGPVLALVTTLAQRTARRGWLLLLAALTLPGLFVTVATTLAEPELVDFPRYVGLVVGGWVILMANVFVGLWASAEGGSRLRWLALVPPGALGLLWLPGLVGGLIG